MGGVSTTVRIRFDFTNMVGKVNQERGISSDPSKGAKQLGARTWVHVPHLHGRLFGRPGFNHCCHKGGRSAETHVHLQLTELKTTKPGTFRGSSMPRKNLLRLTYGVVMAGSDS